MAAKFLSTDMVQIMVGENKEGELEVPSYASAKPSPVLVKALCVLGQYAICTGGPVLAYIGSVRARLIHGCYAESERDCYAKSGTDVGCVCVYQANKAIKQRFIESTDDEK
eukprot:1005365-Rhodomonas_salina.2